MIYIETLTVKLIAKSTVKPTIKSTVETTTTKVIDSISSITITIVVAGNTTSIIRRTVSYRNI